MPLLTQFDGETPFVGGSVGLGELDRGHHLQLLVRGLPGQRTLKQQT